MRQRPFSPSPSSAAPLSFSLCLCLCLLLCALLPASLLPVVASDGGGTGLVGGGSTLNIAVVINCLHPALPSTPFPHRIDASVVPIEECGTGTDQLAALTRVYRTFSRVAAERGGIPMDSGYRAPLRIEYFNIGGLNLTAGADDPMQMVAQFQQAAQNAYILAQQLGAYGGYNPDTNTWDAACPHCPLPYEAGSPMAPGTYGRFPVILTPALAEVLAQLFNLPPVLAEAFFSGCQLSKACIAISPFGGSDSYLKCIPQPDPSDPSQLRMPKECTKAADPSLRADKRPNARRFDFGFSSTPSPHEMMTQMVNWFKLKNAQSAVLFATSNPTYAQLLAAGVTSLEANRISLLMPPVQLPPSGSLSAEQARSYAERVMALQPELVFFVGDALLGFDTASTIAVCAVFAQHRWTPKAIIVPGGSSQDVAEALNAIQPGAGAFIYGSIPNDIRIRSPAYHGVAGTPDKPNWEPFPSDPDGTRYSPKVLEVEYLSDWNQTPPNVFGYSLLQYAIMPFLIATRLFFAAGTDDAVVMQQASLTLAEPSAVGLISFDEYGRSAQTTQYVVQHGATASDIHLITPLDVGEPDVYPMPTFAERVGPHDGSASFLGRDSEKAVVAVTTLANAYLLALLLGVLWNRHTAVIKSSAPAFCCLTLLGGMICISSNYAHSFHAVAAACAANAWMLTTGFTLMVSALFAKTWRIYKIFQAGNLLQVVRITNRHLYILVGSLVGLDIVVNLIWSVVSGFPTQYISVDPYRPLYDSVQCGFGDDSLPFVYLHVALKCAALAVGIALTILARNVPSLFNETPHLAASMYNCTLLLAFLLPVVGTQVGGTDTTYLVRSYGLLLLVLSTASILFVPKFLLLRRAGNVRPYAVEAAQLTPSKGLTPGGRTTAESPANRDQAGAAKSGGKSRSTDGHKSRNSEDATQSSPNQRAAPGATPCAAGTVSLPSRSPTPTAKGEDEVTKLRQLVHSLQREVAQLRQRLGLPVAAGSSGSVARSSTLLRSASAGAQWPAQPQPDDAQVPVQMHTLIHSSDTMEEEHT